nr:MAG TPA: hypothetical protein [Bacteriophage sp.]
MGGCAAPADWSSAGLLLLEWLPLPAFQERVCGQLCWEPS